MVVEGGCVRPTWEFLILAGIFLLMYVGSAGMNHIAGQPDSGDVVRALLFTAPFTTLFLLLVTLIVWLLMRDPGLEVKAEDAR